jgi:hypothetical protein
MSEPRSAWISMERSGVSSWVEPSTWDWKTTPRSSTFLRSASDIT